jgi:hypothetical protein
MDDASVQPQGESASHDHTLLSALEIARQTAEEAGKEAERMQRRYQKAKTALQQKPTSSRVAKLARRALRNLQKSSERSIKAQLLRSEAEKVLLDTQAPRPGPVPSVAPEKLPKYTPMPKNLPKVNRENLRTKKQCEVFLKKYEDACVSNPMTEHGSHRWPLWLRLVVEDADKEDLDVLRKLDGTQDWRTAKESFTGRFASKASVYDACRELAACQQRTTESAQAFSERFNRLAEECQLGESDGPSWKTHLLFTYLFQTKLRPRTAKAMMTSNPGKYTSVKTDFDGMQELAKEAESHINDVGLMREQLQQGIFRLEGLGNAAVRSKGSNNTATLGNPGNSRDSRFAGKGSSENKGGVTSDSTDPISAATSTDAAEYNKAQEGGASPRKNYNDSETSTTRTHSGKRSYQQTSGGEEQWLDELLTLPDYKRPKKSKLRNDPNHSDHGDHSDRNDGSEHSEHSESGESGDSASSV